MKDPAAARRRRPGRAWAGLRIGGGMLLLVAAGCALPADRRGAMDGPGAGYAIDADARRQQENLDPWERERQDQELRLHDDRGRVSRGESRRD